jgi:hypothetical protein
MSLPPIIDLWPGKQAADGPDEECAAGGCPFTAINPHPYRGNADARLEEADNVVTSRRFRRPPGSLLE